MPSHAGVVCIKLVITDLVNRVELRVPYGCGLCRLESLYFVMLISLNALLIHIKDKGYIVNITSIY